MANAREDSDLSEDDDYYAWLGINKSANKEDIAKAYRRLSRAFHPDKHQESSRKQQASLHFRKITKAYEVLSNPTHRLIYDTAGVTGLKLEGWQLQERYKSPKDLLDEMERRKEEEEEDKFNQCTNSMGLMTVDIKATDLFDHSDYNTEFDSMVPAIEVSGSHIKQSLKVPLSSDASLGVWGSVKSVQGEATSKAGLSYSKTFNHKMSAEASLSISSNPHLDMSCFRNVWPNGSASAGIRLQMGPHGTLTPIYSLNFIHQFDSNLQGSLGFIAGDFSAVHTSMAYSSGSHFALIGCQLGVLVSMVRGQYNYYWAKHEGKLKVSGKISNMGFSLHFSWTRVVSRHTALTSSVSLESLSGVHLKLSLSRGQQTFKMPIHLSENLDASALFYATLVPLVTCVVVKRLLIDPYLHKKHLKNLKAKKEKHAELLEQHKREAIEAVELMKEVIDRSYEVEEATAGLVLRQALYGKDVAQEGSKCIDVTRCLQALVKYSSLFISSHTKLPSLPGFYDPCYGEDKELSVSYTFQRKPHKHLFKEGAVISLPSDEHLVSEQ